MFVVHEGEKIQLQPCAEPIITRDALLILMQSSVESETIYVSIPRISVDFKKVATTDYSSKYYRSNYWQEGMFSNIRTKCKGTNTSVGFLFPASTLALEESDLCDPDAWTKLVDQQEGVVRPAVVKDVNEIEQVENRYADEFVRAFAIAAIYSLLKRNLENGQKIEVSWGETYNFEEFVDDSTVVAIYDTKRINPNPEVAKRSIDDFSLEFAHLRTFETLDSPLRKKIDLESFNDKKIIHVRSRENNQYDAIIDYLLQQLAPYESTNCDPIIRFFLQYQLFELLMSEVFSGVIRDFLRVAQFDQFSQSAWKTKELVGKLNEKSSENYRISKIFGLIASKFQAEADEIKAECTQLLRNCGQTNENQENADTTKEPRNPYYLVRNLIFHGFGASNINRDDIDRVCDSMAKVIFKLGLEFSDPVPYFDIANIPTTCQKTDQEPL